MKPLLILIAGIALFAAEASDTDKLKIREAQLARVTFVAQIAQLEGQYRDLKAALDKAAAAEQAAIAELGKRLNCAVDAQTLACPKPEAPKQ